MKLLLASLLLLGVASALPDRNGRIVGGIPADPNSAPFMVSLQIDRAGNNNFAHLCGGSILSDNWALTAAHCIDKNGRGSIYRMIAGQYDLGVASANQQIRSINRIEVHPQFSLVPDYGPNDIALVHGSTPFVWIPEFVDVAILPLTESTPFGQGTLYGWGSTSGQSVQLPTRLQTLTKDIWDSEICNEFLGGHTIYPWHVCTEPSTGQGPCEHDAGGPLMQYYFGYVSVCANNNDLFLFSYQFQYQIVGINSFISAYPCGAVGSVSVYTLVSHYNDWIYSIVYP